MHQILGKVARGLMAEDVTIMDPDGDVLLIADPDPEEATPDSVAFLLSKVGVYLTPEQCRVIAANLLERARMVPKERCEAKRTEFNTDRRRLEWFCTICGPHDVHQDITGTTWQ